MRKNRLPRHTDLIKTILHHPYAPKFAILQKKTAKNGRFLVKIEFFGGRQVVEDLLSLFRGCLMPKRSYRHARITKTQFTASV